MQSSKLFSIFLLYFLQIDASPYCPRGSFQMPQENVCVFDIEQADYYHNVVRKCATLGGVVAKITNVFDNSVLFGMIHQVFNDQPPYIGVERQTNGTWTYADGSPLNYTQWKSGEPKNTSNSICAIMDPSNGQWISTDSSVPRPSFCIAIANPGPCPSNWVYSQQTNFCYYLQNFIYADSQQWRLYNFTEAEGLCQKMNSHLVSIHSKIENDFVMDLVGTNLNYTNSLGPLTTDGNVCYRKWTWIGYYGTGVVNNGYWTDGTPVDYIYSYFGQERNWLISNDPSCNHFGWGHDGASSLFSRFMCKMKAQTTTTTN